MLKSLTTIDILLDIIFIFILHLIYKYNKLKRLKMLSFKIPRVSNNKINSKLITEEMFKELCEFTPFIVGSRETISKRIYCILNNISEIPKCPECSNNVNWLAGRHKFATYCSNSCSRYSQISQDKSKATSLEKYGVVYPIQSKIIQNKSKVTCLKNHGVEYSFQSLEIQNKSKATCLEIYGFEYASQNKDVQDKAKKQSKITCLEKYNVEHSFQAAVVKEKIKATNLEKYGSENVFGSEHIKEKIRETNLEKFGVENPMQCKEVQVKNAISTANHYQQRRNDEGTDFSGVVYILHFKEHNAVKIGLTHSSYSRRFNELKNTFGDFDVIDIIETDSCYKLESELHAEFNEHRICLESGAGRTEFFNECILDLISF